ncbi:hypothetical protein C1645_788407 [Glomus cerebriforme]|uniref:C2H2-type domain-containing protein n=1 Tax=Glomus cerebriforme TaxID=658196 RepID=A0A397S7T0_9GLOM|nr:hypothetical protein C1645_788407 [Glomus cerebriforme]
MDHYLPLRRKNLDLLDTLGSSNFSGSSRLRKITKFLSFNENEITSNNDSVYIKVESSNENNNNEGNFNKDDNGSSDDSSDTSNNENNTHVKNFSSDEDSSLDDNISSGDYSDSLSFNSNKIEDKASDYYNLEQTKRSHSKDDKSYLRSFRCDKEKYTNSNGDKPYKCKNKFTSLRESISEKPFKRNGTKNYRRIQTGKRPYVRNKSGCKKKNIISVNLAKNRTGKRSYECNEPGCEKKYTSLCSLKVHKRIHTNEKPYKCAEPGCIEVFRSLYFLRLHSKRLNHKGYSYTKYNS